MKELTFSYTKCDICNEEAEIFQLKDADKEGAWCLACWAEITDPSTWIEHR